jgi:hypothetical protein
MGYVKGIRMKIAICGMSGFVGSALKVFLKGVEIRSSH